ncbi:Sec-independent protein translocase protein TatB [Lysobacter sp. CA199]|uniref:Sec-independent protein translocase protein TatB n=1 Tax=Lysobacter sp. CA199 TaxID=3455608 RepID=UPI003F8D37F5
MFDIGFSEVFLIAIVALIVLGPERLPKAARFAGLWVRRARAQWYSVKSELENELADEELKRSLRQAQDDLRSAQNQLRDSGQAIRNEVDELNRRVAAPVAGAAAAADPASPADSSPPALLDAPLLDAPLHDAAPPADAPPTHDYPHDYGGAAQPDYHPAPQPSAASDTDERR